MATYPATNDLSALDATQPTGSEDAGKVDDVLREIRLCFKTVLLLAHSSKGEHVFALWSDIQTNAPYPTPNLGPAVWVARPFTRVFNVGGLDQSSTPSIFKPIAGTYFIVANAIGQGIGHHQIRLFNITDNVPVGNCYGTLVNAGGDITVGTAVYQATSSESTMFAAFVTDGTKTFRLEHIYQVKNTTNGWGVEAGTGTGWATSQRRYANVAMLKVA